MSRFGIGYSILSKSNFSIFSDIIGPFAICIQCYPIIAHAFNRVSKALGGTGSYEGTESFMLYTNAPAVFTWIPILNLIAGIYFIYLNIVGGMNVHNVSMSKSIAILLLSFILFILFLALVVIFIFSVFWVRYEIDIM